MDAGCGQTTDLLLDNIAGCGVVQKDIEYLLITHCHFDHTGGALKLRERIGCKTVCHLLDATYLEEGNDSVTAASWYGASIKPTPIDWKLDASPVDIPLGDRSIRAIHTPGHSPVPSYTWLNRKEKPCCSARMSTARWMPACCRTGRTTANR